MGWIWFRAFEGVNDVDSRGGAVLNLSSHPSVWKKLWSEVGVFTGTITAPTAAAQRGRGLISPGMVEVFHESILRRYKSSLLSPTTLLVGVAVAVVLTLPLLIVILSRGWSDL